MFDRGIARRDFLKLTAAAGLGLATSSALAGCGATKEGQGTFNWLTWSDHYFPEQLEEASTQ